MTYRTTYTTNNKSLMARTSSQATMRPSASSTSPSPSPSPAAVSSEDYALFRSDDQAEFETTSLSAAKALAIQYYKDANPNLNSTSIELDESALFDSKLIVLSGRDWNGKPVYRVCPVQINLNLFPPTPSSSHLHSSPPTPLTAKPKQILNKHPHQTDTSPTTTVSPPSPPLIIPNHMGFYSVPNLDSHPPPNQPNPAYLFIPQRSLKGSISDMKLRQNIKNQSNHQDQDKRFKTLPIHSQFEPHLDSSAHHHHPVKQSHRDADVLGKILGWRNSSAPHQSNKTRASSDAHRTQIRSHHHQFTQSDLPPIFNRPQPIDPSSPQTPQPLHQITLQPITDSNEDHLKPKSPTELSQSLSNPSSARLNKSSLDHARKLSMTNRKPPGSAGSKPLVPFGNGVKLVRAHSHRRPQTSGDQPNLRTFKKSLSSSDLRQQQQTGPHPRSALVDPRQIEGLGNPLSSPLPHPPTLTAALQRASLPIRPLVLPLDETRSSLYAKRRRTMHGVASNESIRTARPDQPTFMETMSSRKPLKPRFQDRSVFDVFNQIPSSASPSQQQQQQLDYSPGSHPSSSTTAHQITVTAQPGDDPRFVIWGEQKPSVTQAIGSGSKKRTSSVIDHPAPTSSSTSNLAISTSAHLTQIGANNSSTSSDLGSSNSVPVTNVRRWSRAGRHLPDPMSSSLPALVPSPSSDDKRRLSFPAGSATTLDDFRSVPNPSTTAAQRILMAATIERWIAELTTRIDPRSLIEFFLTYRTVLRPVNLCMLLTTRFEWTILLKSTIYYQKQTDEPLRLSNGTGSIECLDISGKRMLIDAKEEAGRRIVKVRTFVMLRHWLLNHFEDDFLRDRELRLTLTNWLKNLIHKLKHIKHLLICLDQCLNGQDKGDEDLRILKNLKKVIKQRKEVYLAYNLVNQQQQANSVIGKLGGINHNKNENGKDKRVDVRDIFGKEGHVRTESVEERERKESGRRSALGQVTDAKCGKSDLRLQDGDVSDHITDDDEVEAEFEQVARSSSDEGSEERFAALAKYFGQDTHHLRSDALSAHDELGRERRHTFVARKPVGTPLESLPAATLNLHHHHPMIHSDPGLRIAHSRPSETFTPSTTSNHLPHSYAFPQQHNPLQRYFTSTMGTLGRFKRMINNRSTPGGPMPAEQTEEAGNEICDLLCAKGGLERYFSFFEDDKTPEESEKIQGELSSPSIQYNGEEDGFESQLSLSSSTSNTSSSHLGSSGTSDEKSLVVVPTQQHDFLGQSTESFGRPQSLHESLSTETIKSELNRHHHSVGVGLFKKSLKKRFGPDNHNPLSMESYHHPPAPPTQPRPSISLDRASILSDRKQSASIERPSISLDRQSVSITRSSVSLDRQSASIDKSSISLDRQSFSIVRPSISLSRQSLNVSRPSFILERPSRSSLTADRRNDLNRNGSMSVQLDDLDLSEGSDEDWQAPRPLRRLKGAGDLKQGLRRSFFGLRKATAGHLNTNQNRSSTETNSSIGTRRVPSIAGSMFRRSKLVNAASASVDSLASSLQSGGLPDGEGEGGDTGGMPVVANFVAEGLDSDEDEPGDVEAALRRLEGVIDADREKEKARKVERQMMKSIEASRRSRSSTMTSERTCSSLLTDEETEEDHEDDEDDEERRGSVGDDQSYGLSNRMSAASMPGVEEEEEEEPETSITPTVPAITVNHVNEQTTGASQKTPVKFKPDPRQDAKEAAGASAELWRRRYKSGRQQQAMDHKRSLHKLFVGNSSGESRPISIQMGRRLALPPVHRSFLLDCRTEILAQQFCLIERDLLRKITWQELLLGRWQDEKSGNNHYHKRKEEGEINCWETYIKQRARAKAERKGMITEEDENEEEDENQIVDERSSEIRGLIVRFNLTCNWVASEIVLTVSLEERVRLLGKFIRLAFKCYRQNNFQTLTQIIHGLQTPYVSRLKKTWAKLGIWESRMFRDLKQFTSHTSNFKSLRNVQDSLVDSLDAQIPATEGGAGSERDRVTHSIGRASLATGLVGCIPFLGLYLRDLTVNDELPTYLDPSDPSVPAQIDEHTGYLSQLASPERFGSEDEQLYPLVNIHKFRIYAKVVSKILGFQEASLAYGFEAGERWFLTCLRIKALDSDRLRWLSTVCEG
ncbi:hypothetical protein CROQUDRAFT_66492 [Cronartium quercuum f. sp. fusiforme G11]|uniref:Uncharacterized protein n=1 Tax=Cronartium quercuum f. sp. fusiforme G11 TaxID=708437 RepID=A0A9P6NC18_9BASI|nr:hypothetical protein CROQUDRAFT_66492 [Cronartium quercuum f. sp. fusiforme G11]